MALARGPAHRLDGARSLTKCERRLQLFGTSAPYDRAVIRRALPPLLVAALALAATAGAVSLLPGGTAAKPTQGRTNVDPAWSPDGTRIAFVSTGAGINDQDIWVMRADGTGLINLTPDVLHEELPSWSPDGTRLAFTRAPRAGRERPLLEVIDADGGGRRVLAEGSLPAWSPNGIRIAFTSAPPMDWEKSSVEVIDADGGGRRVLAAGSFPAWSPDGTRIAYVRDGDVWVVDTDGSDAHPLTSFAALRFAMSPAWSPDGSTIAFVVVGPTLAPEPNDVWAVGEDGTRLRRVMTAAFVDGAADWAPDSRSLVFAATKRGDGKVELWRAAVPDGPVRNISNDRAWNATPVFAPGGSRLAFAIHHGGGYLLSDVWTLDLRTGRRRNLTGTASGETVDARTVRPPNRLRLARIAAWLDRSVARPNKPILRVEVRVSNRSRDEVRGALVSVTTRLRSLVPLGDRIPATDLHGNTEQAFRVQPAGAVRVGSRIRVTVSARPRGPRGQQVAVSKELQVVVAARAPVG
jgi:Tol biopolymer transport system component